jgi:hypothetical protein
MNPPESNSSAPVHSLSSIPEVSAVVATALKQNWIETAEQVIGLAATVPGREGLKRLLGLDEAGLSALLAILAEVVGLESTRQLSQPSPGGATGVVLTDEQRAKTPPSA